MIQIDLHEFSKTVLWLTAGLTIIALLSGTCGRHQRHGGWHRRKAGA